MLSDALMIDDLKEQARRRLPKMFFDFVNGGSWTEDTLRSNEHDFRDIKFRQRVLVDLSNRSLESAFVGQEASMPVALAPTGLAGMLYPEGEIHAAQAAEECGIPFTLSTMSICSIEDVAAATTKPFWFQLYVMRDRGFMGNLIERATEARCSALVLTADLQILGQRHNDLRNGLSTPPKFTPTHLRQIAVRPRWALSMLRAKRRSFGNIAGHAKGVDDLSSISSWTAGQFDQRLSWADVEMIKNQWGGKLILKGILDPEDARKAADCGVDAIVVSNHGGRQLDSAPSSISMLPRIVDAVGDRVEIHMDGGIRSGQSVLKALCLGATGVYIGRPFLYGLAVGGRRGVAHAIGILRKELDITLAFCGRRDVREASTALLQPPTS